MKRRKKSFYLFLALLIFYVGFGWVFHKSLNPSFPSVDRPSIFYSNQCRDDLRWTLYKAIQQAKKSIHVIIFGLSEPSIIHALSEKARQIPVTIYYDANNSAKISKILSHAKAIGIKQSNFMHQKILIIDEKLVFLGSANFTKSSLVMHDNLILGFYSPKLAHFLINKSPFSSGHLKLFQAGQNVDLYLLPDPRAAGFHQVLKTLRKAQKSIKIAIFCFTHPGVIEELVQAKKRGVDVQVVIDFGSSLGISYKAMQKLKDEKISVLVNQGGNLLHHKFICIDEKTLLTGSANLTKAAFYKNHDCFVIIHNLNKPQKKFINQLWSTIVKEAR